MDTVQTADAPHRLNVLLNDPQQDWAVQLPQLLEPQGIRAIAVASIDQALSVIRDQPIHAAVVDLGLPTLSGSQSPRSEPGALKLLNVIKQLNPAPPTVVVRDRRFDRRTDDRVLRYALKLEAFSVLDQPVNLEQLLRVLKRLVERHYKGRWPAN